MHDRDHIHGYVTSPAAVLAAVTVAALLCTSAPDGQRPAWTLPEWSRSVLRHDRGMVRAFAFRGLYRAVPTQRTSSTVHLMSAAQPVILLRAGQFQGAATARPIGYQLANRRVLRNTLSLHSPRARRFLFWGQVTGAGLLLLSAMILTTAHFADRRRRQHDLARATQEAADLQTLTRIAAHDIRAPLHQIEFLVNEVVADAKAGRPLTQQAIDDLSLIADRTQRLDALVEKTLGHLQYGAFDLHNEMIDLPALIAEIAQLDLPPDAEVAVDGAETLTADRRLLTVVLRNLASNAAKHSDKGDLRLRVRAIRHKGATEIVVEDNGPGIPEVHRKRVFELFATLNSSATGSSVNGVGLATVRQIVRKMGGVVWINDSPLGGTAFHIRLPG